MRRILQLLQAGGFFLDFPFYFAKKWSRFGSRRHRKTEREEDEELLNETKVAPSSEIRLKQQPTGVALLNLFLPMLCAVLVNGELRDYQLEGLNWLIHLYSNGINGILADEMGLGKTIQSISMLAYLYEYKGFKGPFIIITPKSTLANWMNEFAKWCPVLRPVRFHGGKEERVITGSLFCFPDESTLPGSNHSRKAAAGTVRCHCDYLRGCELGKKFFAQVSMAVLDY